MAIILDRNNKIKTNHNDFKNALLNTENGLRCCFNIDMITYEYTPTHLDCLKLIPLEDFSCKRTIVGNNNTRINIESCFGIFQDDFITIDLKVVELEENKHLSKGLLVNKSNPYYEIINAIAKHFDFVKPDNNNSFILDESELSEIQLVPFRLRYNTGVGFNVGEIESEMNTSEYDAIVESMYCSEYGL